LLSDPMAVSKTALRCPCPKILRRYRQRVDRKAGVTWIVDWAEELYETTKEVTDSAYEGFDERQLFLLVLIQRRSWGRGSVCG